MDFKKECLYCGGAVNPIVYAKSKENVTQYAFYCDCTYGALRYNQEQAYENYLHERELENLTNYDIYADDGRTFREFEQYLNEWCEKHDIDCERCIFGKVGQIIVNSVEEGKYGNCGNLLIFLESKVKQNE